MRRQPALLIALALIVPALTALAQEAEEEFNWSGTGAAVEIRNLNGPIEAEAYAGSSIEVVAIKKGPADDISEVRIDVVEHADGVTICTLYGDDAECGPGEDGRLGSTDGNKTNVRFMVRVPAGTDLVATTMNGAITAEKLAGNATLHTMNGAINASAAGWVRAETMNGAVDVAMGSAAWSGDLAIKTMNGTVTVTLPAGADADVSARTTNGRVTSDWDLEISGSRRNRGKGVLGAGGRDLELQTMNGSIRLNRGR